MQSSRLHKSYLCNSNHGYCMHRVQIDCTKEVDLCRDHHVTGFPSLRVFRKGHDEVMNHGLREHESYKGETSDLSATSAKVTHKAQQQQSLHGRSYCTVAALSGCCTSYAHLLCSIVGLINVSERRA